MTKRGAHRRRRSSKTVDPRHTSAKPLLPADSRICFTQMSRVGTVATNREWPTIAIWRREVIQLHLNSSNIGGGFVAVPSLHR